MSQDAHTNFFAAFQPDQIYDLPGYGRVPSTVFQVGELILPSGRIVACDPGLLWYQNHEPFSRSVLPGTYPVLLTLVDSYDVACVMVQFQSEPPVSWEMALWSGQDLTQLGPNEFFGYGIDSGTGCFVDAQGIEQVTPRQLQDGVDYAFEQRSEMDKWLSEQGLITQLTYTPPPMFDPHRFPLTLNPDTRSFNLVLDIQTGANVIAFPSGYGDGRYASYWGLTVTGELACLVTDFCVLVGGITRYVEIEAVTQFLERPLEHPILSQLQAQVKLTQSLPSWVGSHHRMEDDPNWESRSREPAYVVSLEGHHIFARETKLINMGKEYRYYWGCSTEYRRKSWYQEFCLDEPLQADACLWMAFSDGVYPLQPEEQGKIED